MGYPIQTSHDATMCHKNVHIKTRHKRQKLVNETLANKKQEENVIQLSLNTL